MTGEDRLELRNEWGAKDDGMQEAGMNGEGLEGRFAGLEGGPWARSSIQNWDKEIWGVRCLGWIEVCLDREECREKCG